MSYSKTTFNYNTTLNLSNCISFYKKENINKIACTNNYVVKYLLNNWEYLFKYKVVNLLFKILKLLNLVYDIKLKKQAYYLFSNRYLFNSRLTIKTLWLNNSIIEKGLFKKKYWHKRLNKTFIFKNVRTKSSRRPFFKKPNKKYWTKNFSFVKKYWNNIHIAIKKRSKKNIKLRYSKQKKRFVNSKFIFFYKYPKFLWNFFKWSRKIRVIKRIPFFEKFKKNFYYKNKLFFAQTYLLTSNEVSSSNLAFTKNNFFKKKKKFKKKKTFYKLLRNKHKYSNTKYKNLPLYKSSFKYNPYYNKKVWNKKKRSLRRQLFCREKYKNYFSAKLNFNFFLLHKNYNKLKNLTYQYKLRSRYQILYSLAPTNKLKTKVRNFRFKKFKNQIYNVLTRSTKSLPYIKQIAEISLVNFCEKPFNLYKNIWIYFMFISYLKINVFKNKYRLKELYKKYLLKKKERYFMKFYLRVLKTKVNSSTNNYNYCRYYNNSNLFLNLVTNRRSVLEKVNSILY